jgi:hypothetical protein
MKRVKREIVVNKAEIRDTRKYVERQEGV